MDYVKSRLTEIASDTKRATKRGAKSANATSLTKFSKVHRVVSRLASGEEKIYLYAWRGGPRIHGETDAEIAASLAKIIGARETRKRRKPEAKAKRTIESHCRILSNNIRARSIKAGLPFYLPWEDIFALGEKQLWRCAVSGLPFRPDFENAKSFTYNPYGISVDRKDNTKGYEAQNVRLVLTAVNFALNDWGDEIFLEIARATAENTKFVK